MNDRLHWSRFQFGRARAIFHLPDVFQNAARVARKDKMANGQGNGEKPDEAQGGQQSPSIVDWPGAEEPLLLEGAKMMKNERISCLETTRG